MRFSALLSMALLAVLSQSQLALASSPDSPDPLYDFRKAGYPVIAVLSLVGLLIWAFLSSVKGNAQGLTRSIGFSVVLALFSFVTIILIFGDLASGPPTTVLAVVMMVQIFLALQLLTKPSTLVAYTFLGVSLFNLLALLGANNLFNFNTPIWEKQGYANCVAYFGGSSSLKSRCSEDGYTQLIRVIGLFAVFFEVFFILHLVGNFDDLVSGKASQKTAPSKRSEGQPEPQFQQEDAEAQKQPA